MGVDVGLDDPYQNLTVDPGPAEGSAGLLVGSGVPDGRCQLDGIAIACDWAMQMLENGSAVQCPNNDCGPRAVYVDITSTNGQVQTSSGLTNPFSAYANGSSGFMLGGTLLPDGFRVTFTGFAARAAANSFFSGMATGSFGSAVTDSIQTGLLANMIMSFADPDKRASVDVQKVQDCAKKMFHVENAALDWRVEENIMRFVFFDPAQGPGWFARHGLIGDATAGWFDVTPDLSMDLVEVAHHSPFAGRMGGISRGFVDQNDAQHVHLPNDLDRNSEAFYGLFVHELGNALAFLTHKMHVTKLQQLVYDDPSIAPNDEQQKRWGHSDAGVTFEDCVFGKPVSQQ